MMGLDGTAVFGHTPDLALLVPSLLALLCGAVVGAERAMSGRPAGIRTYALVCFSSAVLMAATTQPHLWDSLAGARGIDPTRVVQGLVTGLGFLGAGVIVREGLSVRGLTTASALWTVCTIGIVIGTGFYASGIGATLLTVAVLRATGPIERFFPRKRYTRLTVMVDRERVPESFLRQAIETSAFHVVQTFYRKAKGESGFQYTFLLRAEGSTAERALTDKLADVDGLLKFALAPTQD